MSLISDTLSPCGVEGFARLLAHELSSRVPSAHDTCAITGQPGEIGVLKRALADKNTLIVNLPMVAWKKCIAAPLRAMMAARRAGKDVVLVLHEWADLDWKRRATYVTYLPFATRILFSSPHVRAQFAADRVSSLTTPVRGLVPIPPNIGHPGVVPATAIARGLEAVRSTGKLMLGHFGAIYPKKQSIEVLEIAARIKAQGVPVHAVFVGSFVGGASVDVKALFEARVRELGLQHDVTVTGYIGPAAEVFAALECCDLFVYRFAEGLTSRRGSVLACLQTPRPVLVNAPVHHGEFDHHPSFRRAIGEGRLTLLAPDAGPEAFAEAVRRKVAARNAAQVVDFARAWSDVGDAVMAVPAATPAASLQLT